MLTLASLIYFGSSQTSASNPTTVSFQGKVVNSDGTNVTDGTYGFVFKLYSVSSGGSAIWTETDSSVTVAAGVFQVQLGANCSFFVAATCNNNTPINFANSNSLYLGITFNSDPAGEMSPRVQMQSVPYAYYADNAGSLGGLAASNYVQLSPSSQQSGNINVNGNGTYGGNLAVTGTYNGNTFTNSSLAFSGTSANTLLGASGQNLTISSQGAGGQLLLNSAVNGLALQAGGVTRELLTASADTYQQATTIQTTSGQALTIDSGTTGALNIATGANAKTITIGNATGATGLIFNSGTAGDIFNLVAGGQILVQSTTAPTADNLHITTSGVTTAGINSLSIAYSGGAANVEGGAGRIDLTTGTTAGGTWDGWRVVGAAPSFGVTQNLYKAETAALTQTTTATTNINGFNLTNSGALVQNTAAGVINWNGVNVTTPTITQTTGAVTANGIQVTVPTTAITTGGTINGLSIANIATGPAAGTLNGLSIGNITTAGAGVQNAISVGTGWVNVLSAANASITQTGTITGVTINATSSFEANGTAGQNQTCPSGNVLTAETFTEGILTANGGCASKGLSDERLKTDIVSIGNNTLDQLAAVNPVTFYYDCSNSYFSDTNTYCDPELQTGVVAQQLMLIFPQLVNQDQWGYYHVDYQGLSVEAVKGVAQLAQFINSSGDANLNNVTVNNLQINGNLNYASTTTSSGSFTSSVVTPQLLANGALAINSGSGGDVTIDTSSTANNINIGAQNAATVNLSHSGGATDIKGALETEGAADFNGPVTMHFTSPDTSLNLDNNGSTVFSVSEKGDVITGGSITDKGGSFSLVNASGTQVISFDPSGDANFSGNLNLASATLSGGLSVGGDLSVSGLSTFQKLATFLGKTVFGQDVEFDGHITVASDTAGYALIRTGESSVHVSFKTAYPAAPIVSANITNGQFEGYSINNVTTSGFDIKLALPATSDTNFSWMTLAVNNPQTATNPLPLTSP